MFEKVRAQKDLVVDCGVGDNLCDIRDLVTLGDNVLSFMIEIGIGLATIGIIFLGFTYFKASFEGNVAVMPKIKARLLYVLVGLFFLMGSHVIVNFLTSVLGYKDSEFNEKVETDFPEKDEE